MTTCPNCHADAFAALKHHVQKTATATGGIAGVIRGVSSALSICEVADVTVVNGRRLHLIANAIIGGLRGGATGCAAGSIIGETIKQSLTAAYLCKQCGHSFD